ncbi:DUF4912 domain-containing protein [Desulfurispira natronophila]|uniref:DUF4912 domain-containing protein n=1 Tax=Desulfurispira natronophila TaxID=682562 RepID=A0A7W8DHQ5_9BACT|nr:DUF4912 domain-containing protein [Desulfurispira natronophila]MBB5022607.1 hypothetical protein [Desulfurispira natronophila]
MDKLLGLPREELITIARGLSIAGRSRMSNRELAEAVYRLSLEAGVSSFYLHSSTDGHLRVEFDNIYLPAEIGHTRACLMYRDPLWAFAYWEITPELLSGKLSTSLVLKVIDAGTNKEHSCIEQVDRTGRWYLNLNAPESAFYIVIGTFSEGGFVELVRSNQVKMPALGISADREELVFYNRQTESRRTYASKDKSIGDWDTLGETFTLDRENSRLLHRSISGSRQHFENPTESNRSDYDKQPD